MNDAAPSFFGVLQALLADDIIRRLAVLADPPAGGRGGQEKNLSLRGLMVFLQLDYNAHLKVAPAWQRFSQCAASIVIYRHKMIGHLDLPTSVGDVALPPVKICDIIAAIDALVPLMNDIELAAFNCTTEYEVPLHGDGNTILHYARQSRRYRDLHIKHFYDTQESLDVAVLLAQMKSDHE